MEWACSRLKTLAAVLVVILARPLTSDPFHQSVFEIGGNVAGRLKQWTALSWLFAELNSQGLTSLPQLLILRAHFFLE